MKIGFWILGLGFRIFYKVSYKLISISLKPRTYNLVPLMLLCVIILINGCSGTHYGKYIDMVNPMNYINIGKDYPKYRESKANYKVGKPYEINGVWYYPREDRSYSKVGIASWYGPKFHNKVTANGEVFDKNEITAAHPTLPMPSVVRVTNLSNGKSLKVRVNDRGPFKKNRIIDLSERAAKLLEFKEQGTAKVRVEFDRQATADLFFDTDDKIRGGEKHARKPVKHYSSPIYTTREAREENYQKYVIQAGAYSSADNAYAVEARLRNIAPVYISEVTIKGETYYRVRLGSFSNEDEAGIVIDKLAESGFTDAIMIGIE